MFFPIIMHSIQIRQTVPVFDIGTVSVLDVPLAKHDFLYTNTGTAPAVIERLEPSCHCTSGFVSSTQQPSAVDLPYTVDPSKSVTIRELVDMTEVPQGPFTRTLSVYLQGQDTPVAVYSMDGVVEPDLLLNPQVLDFGQVTAGQSKSLVLKATIDSTLAPAALPKLVSNNAAITITAQHPVDPGGIGFTAKRTGHAVFQTYLVTVPANMPLGTINGDLSFVPEPGAPPIAAQEFQATDAVVTGQVIGNVTANPPALGFGTLSTKTASTAVVTLIGKSANDVHGMRATTDSPTLTATISLPPDAPVGPLIDGPAPMVYDLIVTKRKNSPTGIFNDLVTVTLANGQRLVIPVNGYVANLPGQIR